jgi:hypothetical protein
MDLRSFVVALISPRRCDAIDVALAIAHPRRARFQTI